MDVGAVVWLLFLALAAYALLAKVAEIMLDVGREAADWLRRRRNPERAREPDQEDPFPWADAQTVRFNDAGDPLDNEDWAPEPWVAPQAPEGATCEACGTPLLPVLYGFPAPEMIEAADEGKIILGGCCPGTERYRCPRCADDCWTRGSSARSQQDQPRL